MLNQIRAVMLSAILGGIFPSLSLMAIESSSHPFPIKTRAAFDLGSGKFKLLVAEVQGETIRVTFSKILPVGLGEDYAESKDQTLSEKIENAATVALQELKKEAKLHGATEFQGIATAIFRKAKNGEAVLSHLSQECKIPLRIVSQEKEGLIGFKTAVALSPQIPEDELISWDSGNASFQIVTKNKERFNVYNGPLGNSLVLKTFIDEVRKHPYTQNEIVQPITTAECDTLVKIIQDKIALPDWLQSKLHDQKSTVIAIGDNDSIFAIAAKNIGSNQFTIEQVRTVITQMANKPTEDLKHYVTFSNPETVLTRVLLLYSVMEKFRIQEVTFNESMGSTMGLLIDSEFWSNP